MDFTPGIVDIKNADTRVPDYLAERLGDLEEDGLDIGAVRIFKPTPTSPAKVMVRLSETGPCSDMPKEYSLNFTKCDRKMHVFAEDIAGRAMMVEGRVDKEFYMKPVLDNEYRQVMQKRNEAASRPKRSVQFFSDVQETRKLGLVPHVREADLIKRAKTVPDDKKERLPRKEVTDMLFRAFERIPHWNFKGLVEQTQQPTIYLKEILNEIAVYNQRGPYKNLYELKPEFKK